MWRKLVHCCWEGRLVQPLWKTVWNFLRKLKMFCTAEETINKMKRESSEWENIFANDTSDKGLIFKIYKEFSPGWCGSVELSADL